MEDYKLEMQILFLRYYKTADENLAPLKKTTEEIWQQLKGVIPKHPIDEHDIYEMLKFLGFQQDLEIIYEQVCIVEADKAKGIVAEYDKREAGRVFVWLLYEK